MVLSGQRGSGCNGRVKEEELVYGFAQLQQGRRVVNADAEVGPGLDSPRIPGAQRAQLVDDPALASPGLARLARLIGARDVTEAFGFTHALADQEVDVVEEKLPALGERDLAR